MTLSIQPRRPSEHLGSCLSASSIETVIAIALFVSLGARIAQGSGSAELPTLTTAEEVRELTADQANRGYPVRLRVVVTYVDFEVGDFFAEDGSAGIYVNETNRSYHFQPGDLLDIEGVTEEPDFAPQIAKAHYRRLGQAPLPPPRDVHLVDMLSTREDSQWVQVDGVVQDVEAEGEHLKLDLASEGRRLLVRLMDPVGLDRDHLVDAKVKIAGVCAATYNMNNQLVGVWLAVPTPRQIRVEEPPATDPFAVPVRPINSLLAFSTRNTSEHRVRVQGTVTLRRPRGLFIQNGRLGLCMPGPSPAWLRPGDRVDVVGFADIGEYTPVLLHALFRRIGSTPIPAPLRVTARDARSGTYDTLRVCLDATLRDVRHSDTDHIMVLQDGDALFEARMTEGQPCRDWSHLLGSRLRLTGICSVNVDRNRIPDTFNILLDSPASVEILARAPWWTLRRAAVVLGLLAGVALAVGVWVIVLRRRVQAQTEIIRRRLESEAATERRYRDLFENATDIVYTTDLEGRFTSLNRAGRNTLGYSQEEVSQLNLYELVAPTHLQQVKASRQRLLAGESSIRDETEVITKNGRRLLLEVHPRLTWQDGKPIGVQGIARDITGRDVAEMELRQAQKLESVGRLASGIAHEINTPIQFVGDNTRFFQDSFGHLQTLIERYREFVSIAASRPVSPDFMDEVRRAEEESDAAYLLEEIPKALTQTLEGVDRVATIVRAMKEFAHPEAKEMAAADINQALQSTLTVARNELKYVARVETDFSDLPLVVCNVGDMNQVFLNLLINAAHAIADVVNGTGELGTVRVHTALDGKMVLIAISDTGGGIPEAIRGRIYDPFFTTKEVGRGTGQGLAIARSIVVDRHKGSLTFETEVGKGTSFYVRLPLGPAETS